MKSTQERLAESYCRPQTEKEWVSLIGYVPVIGHTLCAWSDGFGAIEHENHLYWMTTEIPVSHFTDLIHDRLAPWRLEEDGFATAAHGAGDYKFNTLMGDVIISWDSLGDAMLITMDTDEPLENIATYTDLITLIRLIG